MCSGGDQQARLPRLGLRLHLAATGLWLVVGVTFLVAAARPRAGPSDEVAHAVLFAGATFSVIASAHLAGWSQRGKALVIAVVVMLAPVTELAQAMRPGRSAQLSDVVADLVGVAIGVSAHRLWRAVWSNSGRAWAVSGAASLVAVALAGTFAVAVSVRESGWWRCRGQSWSAVVESAAGLEHGPLLELVGADREWRWEDQRWSADGPIPQTSATSVWCGMVVARAFTAVVVVDSDRLRAEYEGRTLALFASGTRSSGRAPNLEFEARGEVLVVSMRGRSEARVEFESIGAFLADIRWVAMRAGERSLTVDVPEGRFVDALIGPPFHLWALDLPITSAEALTEPVDGAPPLRYVGLFDRALSDGELRAVVGAFADP